MTANGQHANDANTTGSQADQKITNTNRPAERGFSRRRFLANSTKGAAALGFGSALAGCSGLGGRFTPTVAAGAPRKLGANDMLRIGVIGSGGQGTHDCYQACRADNVVCVALCDLADFRMDIAEHHIRKTMEEKGHKGVKIDRYHDYRKLLERQDIDGVIIATPDVWHYRPFLSAVQAGKHIYQEKPFSYTIQEGLDMVAAAKKRPELTVQIGTQRRSGSHYPKAKKLIDDGVLGDITYVRARDCRNFVIHDDPFAPAAVVNRYKQVTGKDLKIDAKNVDWDTFQLPCDHKVDFDPWRYTAWRWYWDYAGGLICDVGIHVMDVVHWLTGSTMPKSAVCNGGVYGLKYWETPDVVDAVWDYGSHCVAFISNFTNGFEGDGLTIFGTKATMDVRGAHIYVYADGQRDKPIHELPPEGEKHQVNWIDSIRSGKTPNAPVELGFESLLPSHLANIAYRTGRRVSWDPVAKKVV